MNESVAPLANSLILMGLTLRTFSVAESDCSCPSVFQEAFAIRSPLNADLPEVTLNVVLTVAPGATGPAMVAELFATTFHPRGAEMLNLMSDTGAPVTFLNVTVVSCDDPGENVWSPGGVSVAEAGVMLKRATSYFAATMFACNFWLVSFDGKVPAAVIA